MDNLSPFVTTIRLAISNTWPMLLLFVVIMAVIRISSVLINHDKIVFYKEFYYLLGILYLLLLYYLLLSTENASSGINFIPFKEMTRYSFGSKLFMYNVVGNIVLFIPFGFFISSFLKAKKIHHIFFPSFLISLTAELIQFKIGRAFDVDDVILNVLGAIVGFGGYLMLQSVDSKLPQVLRNNIFYNVISFVILIILLVIIFNLWEMGWFFYE